MGAGVRLGPPDADIPLAGLGEHRILAKGRALELQTPSGTRSVSQGRPIGLGRYTLYLTGSTPGTVLTVFGKEKRNAPPGYYEYDRSLVFFRSAPTLRRNAERRWYWLPTEPRPRPPKPAAWFWRWARLRACGCFRIASGGEESELEIFFRDESNGQGTYPAGRFVSLIPLPNGRYRLDFNRARNPFCAYNAVYPCPAPWRGNTIPRLGTRWWSATPGGGACGLHRLGRR